MKITLIVFTIAVSMCFISCSSIIKNAINKKYPPVSSLDKKLKSVCISDNSIDTTKSYHAEINISKEVIDTISHFELEKTNGLFVVSQGIIDSIKIKALSAILAPQELSISGNQKLYISSNKFIKSVDFNVSASVSPYYLNDTIYLNPFFNRIIINKIHFNKCSFLTKAKPLVKFLNSAVRKYIDNINGRIKNYFVVVKPLPEGGIKVSDILSKQEDVTIVKDAVLNWREKDFNSTIFINDKSVNFLLIEKPEMVIQNSFVCDDFENMPSYTKYQLFNVLHRKLETKYNYIVASSFDTTNNDEKYLTRVRLSSEYLQTNLNYAFDNLNFQFQYPIGYKKDDIYSDITIHKPEFDCVCSGFCDRLITGNSLGQRLKRAGCKLFCVGGGGTLNPLVGAFFAACETGKANWPDNYTIGSVKGNVNAGGILSGSLKKFTFSNSLSKINISKDLAAAGNLNYNFQFTSLNHFSIERLIFTLATQCVLLDLSGNPSVTGSIPEDLNVDIVKEQNLKTSTLKLTIQPFTANVVLSKSPGMEIVTEFKNRFTCGIGYSVFGASLILAQILPSSIIPEKFANYFDAATIGKYNHLFKLKSFTIPLNYRIKSPIGDIGANTLWGIKSLNVTTIFQK